MHRKIEPSILYLGTPVALITTMNEDGTINVAPNSSVFWLGWSCMLGMDGSSQTTKNLQRTGQCVLNMPTFDQAEQVNAVSLYTGTSQVPVHKRLLGYQYKKDKLADTDFSLVQAETVAGARIEQCPIQLEAKVAQVHRFGDADPRMGVSVSAFELTISAVYADEQVLLPGEDNKIDPLRWNPLIMCFRRLFGLSESEARSKLFSGNEDLYAPWKINGMLGHLTRIGLAFASGKKAVESTQPWNGYRQK